MRTTIVLLCGWLAMVIIAAESRTSHLPARPMPNQVEIHYRFQESGVTLHEPVVVLFAVHNGLSQPVTLTLGQQNRQFFQFSLTTPDGQVLQSAPFPEEEVTFGSGKVVVPPGANYQKPLLINQWFQFRTSGTYLLTSQLTTNIDVSGDGSLPPQSQTTPLRVNPKDPARLEKACAELTRQVAMAPNAEAAQEPALMLSYVEDPIAVQYLAQVLSAHKLTQRFAIAGLERVGDDAAIEVLLSALDDKFSDTADLARQTLRRMEDRISNSVLKERVRRALAPRRSDDRANVEARRLTNSLAVA